MSIWEIRIKSGYHSLWLKKSRETRLPYLKSQPVAQEWPRPSVYVSYGIIDDDTTPNPGDFPYFSGSNLTCSERALSVLEPLVAHSVEVLPLDCEDGSVFYVLNVLNVIDCVDHSRTVIEYFDDGLVKAIHKLRLKPDCIGDKPIFKIPERLLTMVFVSDAFKKLVEDNQLVGLTFIEIPEE